jgi:hypothetical protein
MQGKTIWMFQLDFEIFRTIVRFIEISLGHSLIIKLILNFTVLQDNLRNRWAAVHLFTTEYHRTLQNTTEHYRINTEHLKFY